MCLGKPTLTFISSTLGSGPVGEIPEETHFLKLAVGRGPVCFSLECQQPRGSVFLMVLWLRTTNPKGSSHPDPVVITDRMKRCLNKNFCRKAENVSLWLFCTYVEGKEECFLSDKIKSCFARVWRGSGARHTESILEATYSVLLKATL